MEQNNKPIEDVKAIGEWMLSELKKQNGVLYQEDAVAQIADKFGEHFTYENQAGNPAIDKHVLDAFRKLTSDSIVWSRGERLWRLREPGDANTRLQE